MSVRPAQELWETALGEIELQVNKPNFRTWFAKTVGLKYDGSEFIIGVPNTFVAEYLEVNQRSLIEKTLINITHSPVELGFQLVQSAQVQAAAPQTAREKTVSPFNPRYTFESFIVGSCNRLAHAASLAAAQNPGKSYNPLYIYAAAGLGKTHLLQAIGHLANLNRRKALYVSGEQFTTDFISSIRNGQTEEFRARYRDVDLLLLDDVQFIGGKEQTEECLFHTFNDLHNSNRQIVISADSPPKSLPQLAERLRSRFEWGLTIEIEPPDEKTRLELLQLKAEQSGTELNMDTLEYLAQEVKHNIRELEGSLNRVLAYARLLRATITPDLAARALSDIGSRPVRENSPLRPGNIISAVSQVFQIPATELLGAARDKDTALARQFAMFMLKQQNSASLVEIGQSLGGRSASTVSHACDKIQLELENSAFLRLKMSEVQNQLSQQRLSR
ncbi:MAG: chromosomal replication initiator protein DnaA [Dehalococcoides mccartyi]|uniref:chromosomal replication initiator protein DnaA n=1 Tax=Dehalococcoides mccartyi TaxID=61435 RepID=UPI00098ED687|nr:chromosomal replication initiator protein DnaA [Dehalococcoides mccartyi]AQU02486.1 chromosomal replication initiation protein DnaA [Dehalococcoides mccartyi]AQU03849.1 chromosomal replication initiation protein DnaA [Dehalococcoides mccartyi]MCF7635088.1 chromosomal replication initiator protein DnaA [Dehalococcoides mccartyi]MDN4186305.1 chromosomal replication initiator protein DnaA [Dehalococcoides mccartyi]MEA2122294.1 Chromosomal replication initiator protein DnaA [Dehalococcoides mcc